MEKRMYMNSNDLYRLEVLTKVKEKRLKQSKAARLLGISPRQARRLLRRLRNEGPKGIISKKVGAPGNRRLPQEKVDPILEFFKHPDHYDFGPTLTHEYLAEMGTLETSISFVRNVMIQNDLWHSKKIRELKIHELRPRRSKIGELIQLDGSEHDWFEGRGPRCTLLVFIDDATSETLLLKFVKSENTLDYFDAAREYIEKHGRPEALYPDRHSVFRVNHENALSGDGRTQFGRAMEELGIELICANSPQAKGRVERRNRDFQNRLIKAMRIAKICNIEAANAFIPSFLKKFNDQFAKAPKDSRNAHRPLLPTHNLDKIFCLKEKRRLSKNLTLQYKGVIYQVITDRREYTLRKADVTVLETRNRTVSIEHRGITLTAVPYHQMQAKAEIVSGKELLIALEARKEKRRPFRPSRRHPWKSHKRGYSTRQLEPVYS